jgi:organic radical activating enzyme
LWSGREVDRFKSVCQFCDTDFVGGITYSEDYLIKSICDTWGEGSKPFVVFTGGEPGLQLTPSLIHKLRIEGFDVSVETNGTVELPEGVYWRTVSPKSGSFMKQTWGNELKVVWPQDFHLEELKSLNFDYFYIQPMDNSEDSLQKTLDIVMKDPWWRLSLQTHKIIGVE